MLEEDLNRRPGYIFNMRGLFSVVLGHISRMLIQHPGPRRSSRTDIGSAIAHINKNFRKPLDIASLARLSHMSRPSFQRKFLLATGTSPLQYQLKLKIQEAMLNLRMTRKSIAEIAFDLGFPDSNYFGRQFRKQAGISPGKYRSEGMQPPRIPAFPD